MQKKKKPKPIQECFVILENQFTALAPQSFFTEIKERWFFSCTKLTPAKPGHQRRPRKRHFSPQPHTQVGGKARPSPQGFPDPLTPFVSLENR